MILWGKYRVRVDLSCWSIHSQWLPFLCLTISNMSVPIQKGTPIFSSYGQICYRYEQKEGGSLVVVIESAMKVIIYRVVSSFSLFILLLLLNPSIVHFHFFTTTIRSLISFERLAQLFTTFYSFTSLTKSGLEIIIVRFITNPISFQRNGIAPRMQPFFSYSPLPQRHAVPRKQYMHILRWQH